MYSKSAQLVKPKKAKKTIGNTKEKEIMFYKTKQNKYSNVLQTYNGRSYRSKKEAAYAMELDIRKKGKDITDWEYEPRIELKGENGAVVAHYKVDFKLYHKDGSIEYVEVKGFETDVWRLKWKLFEDKFGHDHNIKLTIVK